MSRKWISSVAAIMLTAMPAGAEDRAFRLLADPALERSGLLAHVLPRFSLKTAIGVETVDGPPADVILGDAGDLAEDAETAFRAVSDGGVYVVRLAEPNAAGAPEFVDWLLSEIGQQTVAAFRLDGAPLYRAAADDTAAAEVEMPEGDTDLGEKLALLHCGRCHVVNERNRMGGIGSTPSFAALRSIPGWQDRFLIFWTLNPHPSFTQVEGMTEPFDPDRPPHIAPIEITQDEMEAILAYTATILPKDLGAEIDLR